MQDIDLLKSVYDKHKNLKLAAKELGMAWQTLYWNLKKVGHNVIGNKLQYGSETDQFARKAELDFLKIIPSARDLNEIKFQSKCDFEINEFKVDVKASNLKNSHIKSSSLRWAFSIKKQEVEADFIVCFGYKDFEIEKILLIPREVIRHMSTISLGIKKRSKWEDFAVSKDELKEFFEKTILN